MKGHKFETLSGLHIQLFLGWQSRASSPSEWGWCLWKRHLQQRGGEMLAELPASADGSVCFWVRADPGKGSPPACRCRLFLPSQ